MASLGNFFFRYRNGLFPLVFVLALMAGRPRHAFGRPELDTLLDLAGALVALLGESLRVLTIGYEYIIRGGKDRRVYAAKLVQGGVFAHCRNPLYLGNLLIVAGLALIIHSHAFYLIFIPFMLLAYTAIVAAEEAYLRARFGTEYEQYCRRVNRWWPRWNGYRRSLRGMRFNWRRVLVKEYNTVLVLMAAIPCLELWSEYMIGGPAALPAPLYLIGAALLWLNIYLIVRTLKKSGLVRG
jgi:protein-S-isoprenylcysteine O-methyltransferase Ste14